MPVIPDENLATIPIQLRHDTFENYYTSKVSLRDGEFFVDSNSGAVRVGHSNARLGLFFPPESLSDAVIIRDVPSFKLSSQLMNKGLIYGRPYAEALEQGLPISVILSIDDTATLSDGSHAMGPVLFDRLPYDKEAWGIAYNPRLVDGAYVFDILLYGVASIPAILNATYPGNPPLSGYQLYAYTFIREHGIGELAFSDAAPHEIGGGLAPGQEAFFLGTRSGTMFHVGMYLHLDQPNPIS